jgi:hypothetical protein
VCPPVFIGPSRPLYAQKALVFACLLTDVSYATVASSRAHFLNGTLNLRHTLIINVTLMDLRMFI